MRNGSARQLARHFFSGLFDFGFLSETAAASFTRLVIGVCATFLSFGLLLTRVYVAKYAGLSAQDTARAYQVAILADHALIIAIPMWIVALAIVLIGHAVFPDELDFRVLGSLPLMRRLIFGAKLAAVTLFAGLFIAAAHVALAPLLLLTIVSRWADLPVLWQLAAYLSGSLLASAFAVLAVAAVQGLFVVWAPRGRALAISAVVRSLMLCGLMLGLPLVGRLPAAAEAFARGSTWLYVVPPAWFVGLERLLLGDRRPQIVHLAEIAALAFALAAAVVAVSYATLYRDFDRLIVRPAASPPHDRVRVERAGRVILRARAVSNPVFVATRTFTAVTLRRSVLHQGIVVALSTIGAGLVVNSLLAASPGEWLRHGSPSRQIIEAIVWAPFALMYAAARAVRLGLSVPIEQRANWIFRMTESALSGPQHLRAAVHTIGSLGILVPVAVTFPFQWLALGVFAFAAAAAALLCGWLYVELLTKDWDRVPFTCSYIPGKGFVPQAMITGAVSFVLFTTFGAALARGCAGGHPAAYVLLGFVALGAAILRRRRLDAWRTMPLQFEDVLPTEVNPLRLSAD